jgi:hypothetical protein
MERLTHPASTTHDSRRTLAWVWPAAIALFMLAGATGALFRIGMFTGLPGGLNFGDVRHAHSHLMFFGWVTPALMALIATRLAMISGRPVGRLMRASIAATLVLALVAYVPFLLFGYRPMILGDSRLPLSVIASSLNMFAWYGFIVAYARMSRGLARSLPVALWDAALAFLALASLGAWGRAVLVALPVADPFLETASVHLFLDLFADGWFLLALLGLIAASTVARRGAMITTGLLALGLPPIFLLGVRVALVPPTLRLIAAIGGVIVGVSLLVLIAQLWRARSYRLVLALLAVKALALILIAQPDIARWAQGFSGLRLLYLHIFLLGSITLGLIVAARETWGAAIVPRSRAMTLAIGIMIVSLVPFTPLWPRALAGMWTLHAAAIASLGPVLAAVPLLLAPLRRPRESSPERQAVTHEPAA